MILKLDSSWQCYEQIKIPIKSLNNQFSNDNYNFFLYRHVLILMLSVNSSRRTCTTNQPWVIQNYAKRKLSKTYVSDYVRLFFSFFSYNTHSVQKCIVRFKSPKWPTIDEVSLWYPTLWCNQIGTVFLDMSSWTALTGNFGMNTIF